MSSTSAELAGATTADIASAREALIEYLQERWPTLAIRGGPLADLVLGPSADALAAVDVRAERVSRSYNPEAALASGDYDAEVLNSVLAGRGVYRRTASAAAGSAAIRFSNGTQRLFAAGFRFKAADGTVYVTSSPTRLLVPGSTAVLDGDFVLVEEPSGGTFIGIVPISAKETGLSGNRAAGTSLTAIDTFDSLTAAWTATDISGGLDAETDAALLARLPSAVAPRTAASLAGAEALIRDAIPAISTVSTVKFGDPQLMRGRSVLSLQTPGRFDIRYRTASPASRERKTVTATYIGLVGPYGSWRFTLQRNELPGRFRVEKIVETSNAITAPGHAPVSVSPGFDLSGVSDPPDIRSVADAAMSRYATAVVVFVDPDTPTDGLTANTSTKDYDVVCRLIHGVEDGQTAVDADDARAAGGDCLVRTAVVGLVSVTAAATAAPGVVVTTAQVASAVAQAINSAAGIDSRLSAPQIAAAAAAILPRGTALLLSGWSGIIYPSDGGDPVQANGNADGLSVANDFSRNIGPATVAWYCDPESVVATVS